MKRPQVRNIIPHFVRNEHHQSLSDRIADLHIQVIESRLDRLDLTTLQKLTVIDNIIANIQSGEAEYINK